MIRTDYKTKRNYSVAIVLIVMVLLITQIIQQIVLLRLLNKLLITDTTHQVDQTNYGVGAFPHRPPRRASVPVEEAPTTQQSRSGVR